MKKINIHTDIIKIVTLNKFLDLVPIRAVDRELWQFDVCLSHEARESMVGDVGQPIDEYVRKCTVLSPSDFFNKNAGNFLAQAITPCSLNKEIYEKFDFQELMEKQWMELIENFGNPTHLVRIGPRRWVMGNPNDFEILYNPHKDIKGVVCYWSNRNVYVNFTRPLFSQQEIQEILSKAHAGIKL